MYNKGQIELDTKKKIKHKAPPLPAPKPPAKPVKNEYDYQLSISERAMIEKRRENAKREKALGEQILKEQNV
jgi:hypothetical protein